nr:MAG TPA: hypothetical protein [Caudoviricetes sp.]
MNNLLKFSRLFLFKKNRNQIGTGNDSRLCEVMPCMG